MLCNELVKIVQGNTQSRRKVMNINAKKLESINI